MKEKVLKSFDKLFNIKTIIILFILFSIPYFDLPGLYMDAINPDYVAIHIMNPGKISAWVYNDNIIATLLGKDWGFPLLNSLYGTNFPAYIFILFVKLFGSSVFTLRLMHMIFGIFEIVAAYYLVNKITDNKKVSTLTALMIALEPSFVFSQRTQYYLQLFPLIFYFIGLAIFSGKIDISKKKKNNDFSLMKIVLASIPFGLAACSYFIFAGYYFGFLVSYLIYVGFKKVNIKKVFFSVIGFAIGYIPYLYAHISLLLNNGLSGYIGMIKDLDRYGISNGQTSFFNRITDVFNKILVLPSGGHPVYTMTGKNTVFSNFKYIFYLMLMICTTFGIIYIIKYYKNKSRKDNKLIFVITVITACIIIHFGIGIVVGTALKYQHYIMLLPLFYVYMILIVYYIFKFDSNKKVKNNIKNIIYVCFSLVLITDITNIISGYNKLSETGGTGYYSSTINDVGYYLNSNLTERDLIICPQWGYSMGLSLITNGKADIWGDVVESNIMFKLEYLKNNYSKIYILDDNVTDDELIQRIVNATEKKNLKEVEFKNNISNTLDIKLLVLE